MGPKSVLEGATLVFVLCGFSLMCGRKVGVQAETYFSGLINNRTVFTLDNSPYVIPDDVIITKNGSLVIDPGVEIRLRTGVGVFVRGALIAKGEPLRRIRFVSNLRAQNNLLNPVREGNEEGVFRSKTIRLADGPSPLAGRLQLFNQGKWRSVCTNSRNWTETDYQVACRQLGYMGGEFFRWMERLNGSTSHPLLMESPDCSNTSLSLQECDWSSRKMGIGVCDHHPDLGLACEATYTETVGSLHWRGLRFENARWKKELIQKNSLYVKVSESILYNVDILEAGVGPQRMVVSALESEGVPPRLTGLKVHYSAYNGLNFSQPASIVYLNASSVSHNQGYGLYANTSTGLVLVESSNFTQNGADGLKYVYHDIIPDKAGENVVETHDFCLSGSPNMQVYPLSILAESFRDTVRETVCQKKFMSLPDQVLTLHFVHVSTELENGATMEIRDGPDSRAPLLAKIVLSNSTRPQSLTTTRNSIWMQFTAKPSSRNIVNMELIAGFEKAFDVNLTNVIIHNNTGRGLWAENVRSLVHVQGSNISRNLGPAGIHVSDGAADVNVTHSYILDNYGDGVNLTYSGGRVNISFSQLQGNQGHGFVSWINESSPNVAINREFIFAYNQVGRNLDTGILVGNFCREGAVNISGNVFEESQWNAVDVQTCWREMSPRLSLQIGHNKFINNQRPAVMVSPAVNLNAMIEYNYFKGQVRGCLYVRNPDFLELETLPAELEISNNRFEANSGTYVVNVGLSEYADEQRMFVTRNWVKKNAAKQLYQHLNPRSRVAAAVVIASSNINVSRNMIENPDSDYEIGSQLEDNLRTLPCVRNWLGNRREQDVYYRLFDRKDRYNLASVDYKPFLLHDTNFESDAESNNPNFVPSFIQSGTREIGGEVSGWEELVDKGEYLVTRDITIRPTGRLTVAFGVTLKFRHSLGMMVGGELIAEGSMTPGGNVIFALADRTVEEGADVPVRLVGGAGANEGKLQVKLGETWGSVCDYGWNIETAAVACHQIGLVLNPQDWLMERSEVPIDGSEPAIISNVRCSEFDSDIRQCRYELVSEDVENYCGADMHVGLRCHDVAWAGLRLGMTAKKSTLKSVLIERAGLFDYSTHAFQPALRIDLHHHVLDKLILRHNAQDGLGIMYSDIYYPERVTNLKKSEISYNSGHGISMRSLGMQITDCRLEENVQSGVHYNPMISRQELREMMGWLSALKPEEFVEVPDVPDTISLDPDKPRYLRTKKTMIDIEKQFALVTDQRNVIGMQVLNPIANLSTESLTFYDFGELSNEAWNVRTNLSLFPALSSSYRLDVKYRSGSNAKGGAVILLRAVRRSDIQTQRSVLLPGPLPTLTVQSSILQKNKRGFSAFHYNRFLSPDGHHYLRKANESVQIIACTIQDNQEEAMRIHTPYREAGSFALAEIKYSLNYTAFRSNGKGIIQTSRDIRESSNLFHWIMQNVTFERHRAGGCDFRMPYVWQYDANHTHTMFISDSLFQHNEGFMMNIDGHFARVNITRNLFDSNQCSKSLLSLRGMEKDAFIYHNRLLNNKGLAMLEWDVHSQSEILGHVWAEFAFNIVQNNAHTPGLLATSRSTPVSYVVALKGVQNVNVTDNLFGSNAMDYELLAGLRTARLNTMVNAVRNWWGTSDMEVIREKIFDFDDWNSYAIARYRPFLLENMFDSGQSSFAELSPHVDLDNLAGRIYEDVVLTLRSHPYLFKADVTIMPGATLTIHPGVALEFFPNVGILVLGNLNAQGHWDAPIVFRPTRKNSTHLHYRVARAMKENKANVRLCVDGQCEGQSQGYVEMYNQTTLQWVPLCDSRFSERNARVVCRELGLETINEFYDFGRRWEFQIGSLNRVRYWPEPIQCTGNEERLEDCEIRMNGQIYGHEYRCDYTSKFVFVSCGDRNLEPDFEYWGGIRFSVPTFEYDVHERPRGTFVRGPTADGYTSVLQYAKIEGAGILHGERSPAILSTFKSPVIRHVNVTKSAWDGVQLISPAKNTLIVDNVISDNLGAGVSVIMLTGESRDSETSSFSPTAEVRMPYNTFGLLDACDPAKHILVEERVLLYFRYDNVPADCVKIFTSPYGAKTFGFRLLQLNLFNSTGEPWEPDSVRLYDGDLYNSTTSKLLMTITSETTGQGRENRMYVTTKPSLSVKLHATGADGNHGFVAEIVTLPISALGFGRDLQHNISYSGLFNNSQGAVRYVSAGEVSPMITMEWNQILDNGVSLYGNFSTSEAAVELDVQNTNVFYFRNNLVQGNQGGLSVFADSSGVPTALKAVIHNNVFVDNRDRPVLHLEGRRASPYQEATLFYNYITRSHIPYEDVVIFAQMVCNATANYIFNNWGHHIMHVHGFNRARLPILQTFIHNSLYKNYATDRDNRGTVIAGSSGQRYVNNVFTNPYNDYELVAVNWTGMQDIKNVSIYDTHGLEAQRTPIDARFNWWGYNESSAVNGRIRDHRDRLELLEVDYLPFHFNNRTILSGKCDPGWTLVGDSCYLYLGVPMTFNDAKDFCRRDNATLPYLMSNHWEVMEFLMSQQQGFDYYSRVWVQHLDMIHSCTVFVNRRVEKSECNLLLPFVCESDPEIHLDPLGWTDDIVTVAALTAAGLALVLILLCVAFWASKSRHRAAQRLERRNSIRASIRSSRSLASLASSAGFSDTGARRRILDRIEASKPADMRKLHDPHGGSLDSIEKVASSSQFNSSVEDNRSYEIYEASSTNMTLSFTPFHDRFGTQAEREQQNVNADRTFDITYENRGFRDTSTFGRPSQANSDVWDGSSVATDTRLDVQSNGAVHYQHSAAHGHEPEYARPRANTDTTSYGYSPQPDISRDTDTSSIMTMPIVRPATAQSADHYGKGHHGGAKPMTFGNAPPSTTRSQLLETDLDIELPRHAQTMACIDQLPKMSFDLAAKRSHSTPLETDM